MSNIVDFMAKLKAKSGPAAFLCCPACGHENLAVVIRWRGQQPYIAALVCQGCEAETGVIDGTPVGTREGGG
jgi:transcription elongation factor Elf1